jgi:hypothetical protein
MSKNSKYWSNEKGQSSATKIVQQNNSERSTAISQYIWIQIFLFVIFIVLPKPLVLPIAFVVPADLSQQAKSAAAEGLTYSYSIDKKVRKI